MLTAFVVGFIVIGIAGWAWRINLALNHPEKEERLRKLGKHIWEEQAEVAKTVTGVARKGIAFGLKMRRRFK